MDEDSNRASVKTPVKVVPLGYKKDNQTPEKGKGRISRKSDIPTPERGRGKPRPKKEIPKIFTKIPFQDDESPARDKILIKYEAINTQFDAAMTPKSQTQ